MHDGKKNPQDFPPRRDGREETQRFAMASCRSFVSLPCFKHLELWVPGSSPAPQPCGEHRAPALPKHPPATDSTAGLAPGHVPTTAQLPSHTSAPYPAPNHRLCQQRGVFCQPGQAVLEESWGTRGSLLGDDLVLEQIAGICVRHSGHAER